MISNYLLLLLSPLLKQIFWVLCFTFISGFIVHWYALFISCPGITLLGELFVSLWLFYAPELSGPLGLGHVLYILFLKGAKNSLSYELNLFSILFYLKINFCQLFTVFILSEEYWKLLGYIESTFYISFQFSFLAQWIKAKVVGPAWKGSLEFDSVRSKLVTAFMDKV